MPAPDDNRAAWFDERRKPAERLVAFERWLATRIGTVLVWPADQNAASKQIGQCRAFVMIAVADLGRHGFLFRPADLAAHLEKELARIAGYQRGGKIGDLFGYFKACWDGWVRKNAEELRAEAERKRVLRGHSAPARVESIGEIVLLDLEAQHDRKKAKAHLRAEKKAARKGRCNGAADALLPGLKLPGF